MRHDEQSNAYNTKTASCQEKWPTKNTCVDFGLIFHSSIFSNKSGLFECILVCWVCFVLQIVILNMIFGFCVFFYVWEHILMICFNIFWQKSSKLPEVWTILVRTICLRFVQWRPNTPFIYTPYFWWLRQRSLWSLLLGARDTVVHMCTSFVVHVSDYNFFISESRWRMWTRRRCLEADR